MSKYRLYFTTTIRGVVTIEARSWGEAEAEGNMMADDTLNYDQLTEAHNYSPDVITEFDDMDEL